MVYKSACKACEHPHVGSICVATVQKRGTITLRLLNPKSWDAYQNASVQHFDNIQRSYNESQLFDYVQDIDCGCRFYVPKDNLEYLEWRYESTQ